MGIPSNDKLAELAISIAHEMYDGKGICIDCGKSGIMKMHELFGREMRPILGSTVCILGVTLAPLCKDCHPVWHKLSLKHQLEKLSAMWCDDSFEEFQRDQLEAIRARCYV